MRVRRWLKAPPGWIWRWEPEPIVFIGAWLLTALVTSLVELAFGAAAAAFVLLGFRLEPRAQLLWSGRIVDGVVKPDPPYFHRFATTLLELRLRK